MSVRWAVSFFSVIAVAGFSAGALAKPAVTKSGHVPAHHHRSHPAETSCSSLAYRAAMETMHQAMQAPLSGNADVDFARQMIPHHEGAVAMAKIQLQYGRDEKLKHFSRWVIRAQDLEIGEMKQWLNRRDNGVAPENAHDYYGAVMMGMHHEMMLASTGDADLDFVRGMIPHHQGAVDMAAILIAEGNDPELHRLAEDIYRSQNYEISWMQDWLAAHEK